MANKIIVALDPGTFETAWVTWDGKEIGYRGKFPNTDVLTALLTREPAFDLHIEMIGHYGTGMPAGKEVFDTCVWIGRFIQAYRGPHTLTERRAVKLHHCGNMRAKDGNLRQALIDKYGAPGSKKKPGPTHGLSGDLWQAFALATYISENNL